MKEIQANPSLGKVLPMELGDARWVGWNKLQYIKDTSAGKIVVHYLGEFVEGALKMVDDFKLYNNIMIVKHNKIRDGWTGRVLTLEKEYPVIEIMERPHEVSVRIKDEQGTPAIFPLQLFEVTNNLIPPDWKIEFFGKNDFRLSPTVFKEKNDLWEEYFEGDSETRAKAVQIVDEEIEKINAFHFENGRTESPID